MRDEVIVIFGASGFIGRFLASVAASEGYRLRLVSRSIDNLKDLKVIGSVGQVAHYDINFLENNKNYFNEIFANAYAVVNLVGSIQKSEFKQMIDVNANFLEKIAYMSAENGIKKFIHLSTMGVERADSLYFRSKAIGESSLLKIINNATILRPSIVYGPCSWVVKSLICFYKNFGFYPLLDGGRAKIQPVHVSDLAMQIVKFIGSDLSLNGGIYNICGEKEFTVYSFVEYLSKINGIRLKTLSTPTYIAKYFSKFFSLMPVRILIKPITNTFESVITTCAIDLLSTDMVLRKNEINFLDLIL